MSWITMTAAGFSAMFLLAGCGAAPGAVGQERQEEPDAAAQEVDGGVAPLAQDGASSPDAGRQDGAVPAQDAGAPDAAAPEEDAEQPAADAGVQACAPGVCQLHAAQCGVIPSGCDCGLCPSGSGFYPPEVCGGNGTPNRCQPECFADLTPMCQGLGAGYPTGRGFRPTCHKLPNNGIGCVNGPPGVDVTCCP